MSVEVLTPEPGFAISRVESRRIADELDRQVASIWASETVRRPGEVFDGLICSVAEATPASIEVFETRYRYFLAQRRDPELRSLLDIRPLAVSGVLICQDGLVLGRRSGTVEQDRGLWELVPAGVLDPSRRNPVGRPDPVAQLMDELHEEIGLSAHHILLPPQLLAIVVDHDDGVIDLTYCLRTPATADEIAAFVDLHPREHDEIRVVPLHVFLDELERGSLSLSDAGLAIAVAARRAGLFDAGH